MCVTKRMQCNTYRSCMRSPIRNRIHTAQKTCVYMHVNRVKIYVCLCACTRDSLSYQHRHEHLSTDRTTDRVQGLAGIPPRPFLMKERYQILIVLGIILNQNKSTNPPKTPKTPKPQNKANKTGTKDLPTHPAQIPYFPHRPAPLRIGHIRPIDAYIRESFP